MEEHNAHHHDLLKTDDSPGSWLREHSLVLSLMAAAAVVIIYKGWLVSSIGLVALGLGFVIFVHELGHFLAAKFCDVYVETFSIGFGPSFPLCSHKWGETTYKIGVIPLGGYVKMLGEGAEGDEQEDDPRSYKNKTVGQRMLIISAGVIMNLIFAVLGFMVIYMGPGRDRMAGVIGVVDPGSPAWQAGLRSGARLVRVGQKENPYFDQLRPAVALSGSGDRVPLSYELPDTHKVVETSLLPKFEGQRVGLKLIGVGPAQTTKLVGLPSLKQPPFVNGSAASRATPPLEHEETIVATTDPANPTGPLLDLPPDPRQPGSDQRDFFALHRRLVELAGQPVTVRVRTPAGTTRESVIPPSFARNYGLIMRMGPVTATRSGSAAEKVVRTKSDGDTGDVIERVEVKTDKGILRFTNSRAAAATPGVEERPLDPLRLPLELAQWAATAKEPKDVNIRVLRREGHQERSKVDLTIPWDDSWRFDREDTLSSRSPLAVSGLGLTYRVESVVEDVIKDSVADRAGIKTGDVFTGIRLYTDAELKSSKLIDLAQDEWAYAWHLMTENANPTRVDLSVKRGSAAQPDITLNAPEDTTWPITERGFGFGSDNRHLKADGPGQAVAMGASDVLDTMKNVYLSLLRMVDGGISFLKNANGPISIAQTSYMVASESAPQFVLLLCVLSVNLAVLNFLPIPVLDGGHMVFLLYEKLVGRPVPELIRTSATFAGMALLLSLMACVVVLDVIKVFFKS
ncbi:MAG: site-2 protease family protein [Gemmataceae bacterium]|nr:site-2 protease family protein [Gemmataceae bacterium]